GLLDTHFLRRHGSEFHAMPGPPGLAASPVQGTLFAPCWADQQHEMLLLMSFVAVERHKRPRQQARLCLRRRRRQARRLIILPQGFQTGLTLGASDRRQEKKRTGDHDTTATGTFHRRDHGLSLAVTLLILGDAAAIPNTNSVRLSALR